MTRRRRRVAILGGGAGALAAAYALSAEGWQDEFESITVYQRGWRLGGKGASGRGRNDRIEEHGLHIWFGFYRNAFRMLDTCYRERNEARERDGHGASAMQALADAFQRASTFVLTERVAGAWKPWVASFPEDDGLPWDTRAAVEPPSAWEVLVRALALCLAEVRAARSEREAVAPRVRLIPIDGDNEDGDRRAGPAVRLVPAPPGPARAFRAPTSEATSHLSSLPRALGRLTLSAASAFRELRRLEIIESAVTAALTMARALDDDPARHPEEAHGLLHEVVEAAAGLVAQHLRPLAEKSDELRRHWQAADILLACVRGTLADGLLTRGSDAVDDVDFAEWLERHGAEPESAGSALVTATVYDLAFAYRDGDPRQPSCSAATALRGLARLFFDYSGAIAWKMRAGMGDVVFAPMYEALTGRGVTFQFFHQVDALRLSRDGERIRAIELTRQVELTDPGAGYQPLVEVNGLACWPAEPRWEQVANRGDLAAHDLESFWSAGTGEQVVLRQGSDFDDVVLGIGIGALPHICAELVEHDSAWRDMVDNVATVHTQALQLWLSQGPDELGDARPGGVTGGFTEPFDTYADMGQLIERESWGTRVAGIAYFCSVLETPPGHPDPEARDLPERATEQVRRNGIRFLQNQVGGLLPGTAQRYPSDFRWELLVDDEGESGVRRFASQYWRANVDPSDRYVQSLPGTARFRLPPGGSRFSNLYLAGDWTDCGLNAGCVESAVTSGLLASNALCGRPALDEIIGHGHLRGPG